MQIMSLSGSEGSSRLKRPPLFPSPYYHSLSRGSCQHQCRRPRLASAQTLQKTLKEAAPDVAFLGCSDPLGPSLEEEEAGAQAYSDHSLHETIELDFVQFRVAAHPHPVRCLPF